MDLGTLPSSEDIEVLSSPFSCIRGSIRCRWSSRLTIASHNGAIGAFKVITKLCSTTSFRLFIHIRAQLLSKTLMVIKRVRAAQGLLSVV